MRQRRWIIGLALGLVGGTSVKPVMLQFQEHLDSLKPYMSSEVEFSEKTNQPMIEGHLKDLVALVKSTKHAEEFKSPALSISRKVLESHFAETERVFRVGNKGYARWMLNSSLFACMSCHSQTPASNSFPWPKKSLEGVNANGQFQEAEFLFATRRFEDAIPIFDRLIGNYPSNRLSTEQLETALKRKVGYYSQFKRSPVEGAKSFRESLKNKNLPLRIQENATAWLTLFEEWSNKADINAAQISEKDLERYVEKSFKVTLWDKMVPATDPRVVTLMQVSGTLYEYLKFHPNTKLTPQILYWLALIDTRLNNEFFFSLADLYLKECIVKAPHKSIARKCFQELKSKTIYAFSGSRGTDIPMDVGAELRYYENLSKKE